MLASSFCPNSAVLTQLSHACCAGLAERACSASSSSPRRLSLCILLGALLLCKLPCRPAAAASCGALATHVGATRFFTQPSSVQTLFTAPRFPLAGTLMLISSDRDSCCSSSSPCTRCTVFRPSARCTSRPSAAAAAAADAWRPGACAAAAPRVVAACRRCHPAVLPARVLAPAAAAAARRVGTVSITPDSCRTRSFCVRSIVSEAASMPCSSCGGGGAPSARIVTHAARQRSASPGATTPSNPRARTCPSSVGSFMWMPISMTHTATATTGIIAALIRPIFSSCTHGRRAWQSVSTHRLAAPLSAAGAAEANAREGPQQSTQRRAAAALTGFVATEGDSRAPPPGCLRGPVMSPRLSPVHHLTLHESPGEQ